jgi:hypothetical protein
MTTPIALAGVIAGPLFGILIAAIVAAGLVFVAIRLSSEPPGRRSFRRGATREPDRRVPTSSLVDED